MKIVLLVLPVVFASHPPVLSEHDRGEERIRRDKIESILRLEDVRAPFAGAA